MDASVSTTDFIDQLDQNIFIKDLDSNYLFCNDAFASSLGLTKEQVLGKDDSNLFSDEKSEFYRLQDRQIIETGEKITFTEEIVIDGEKRVIKVEKKPLLSQGEIVSIIGIFWDITQEVEKGKKLAKIKKSLTEAQAVAHVGHWELDFVNGSLYCSDEIYRIFGLPPQQSELNYNKLLEFIHPEDLEALKAAYTASKEHGDSTTLTTRIVKNDGTVGFIELRFEYLLDEEGNISSQIGTVKDITELKEAEQKLLLVSKVYEKTNNGVLITDKDGEIVHANEAFMKLSGYSLEEILGKRPNLLHSGWHNASFYEHMWESINTTGSWCGEVWDRRKDGELYTALLSIFEVRDASGEVTNHIAISSDITKQKEKEQRIHNMAYYDTLTQLPNRSFFREKVSEKIERAAATGKRVALLFIDLDNFKSINDTMGHIIGDKLLVEVGQRIGSHLRKEDMLARLSGDEFTLMLSNIENDKQVAIVAKKILAAFAEPVEIEGKKIQAGLSIGIATFPDNGDSYDTLLNNADMAMYHVKESGKSGYQFYTSIMSEEAKRRTLIEQYLDGAIDNKQFFLVYQPKINTRNNHVYGMEALLRWQHPELGLITPEKFIGITEETGHIYQIGLWVARQAMHDMKLLYEHGLHNLCVSINISSLQLSNDHFVDDMLEVLERSAIHHGTLEMEITERCLMRNRDKISEKLNILSQNNVKLTLDDFGTGYTSLSHLQKLPVSTLKIDKNFIKDIDTDEDMSNIASAIIALAKNLNMEVIAEGSESQEHVEHLKSLECYQVQGYFVGRPMPIEEFIDYLKLNTTKMRTEEI